jgi:uncharacterized protein (TIGR03437 family)
MKAVSLYLILSASQLILPRAQAQPVVRGIINAASGDITTIARGSYMTLFGDNLGTLAGATTLPLPITLGGAQVNIKPNGSANTFAAFLNFVSPGQINAIMPSTVPAGPATLTVTVNNQTSFGAPVQVSEHSFGIFTLWSQPTGMAIAQNFEPPGSLSLNLYTSPAHAGQTIVLWGTGLGAYTAGPDGDPPQAGNIVTDAKVVVNDVPITPLYAGRAPGIPGVDQINFTLPTDAGIPDGCSVSVNVQIGGATMSNTATIALSSSAPVCQHPYGLSTDVLTKLQNGNMITAGLALFQREYGVLGVSNASIFGTVKETVLTRFRKLDASGSPVANQAFQFAMSQAPGTCAVVPAPLNVLDYVDFIDSFSTVLSTGSQTLTGPGVNLPIVGEQATIFEGTTLPGTGSVATSGLVDGDWTLSATGGAEVNAFSAKFSLANQFTLTNLPTTITRGQPVTLSWTGGTADDQVRIIAWSTTFDPTTPVVVCTASASGGTFTVPGNITGQLADPHQQGGVLSIYTLGTPAHFTAPLKAGGSLDSGVIQLAIIDSLAGVVIQ